MAVKEELTGIVGAENVFDDVERLKPYSPGMRKRFKASSD